MLAKQLQLQAAPAQHQPISRAASGAQGTPEYSRGRMLHCSNAMVGYPGWAPACCAAPGQPCSRGPTCLEVAAQDVRREVVGNGILCPVFPDERRPLRQHVRGGAGAAGRTPGALFGEGGLADSGARTGRGCGPSSCSVLAGPHCPTLPPSPTRACSSSRRSTSRPAASAATTSCRSRMREE